MNHLSDESKRDMRHMYRRGLISAIELATMYALSLHNVNSILNEEDTDDEQ